MVPLRLDVRFFRKLYFDWVNRLACEAGFAFTSAQSNDKVFTMRGEEGLHVDAHFIDQPPFLRFECSNAARQTEIDGFASDAIGLLAARNLGGQVWYSSGGSTSDVDISRSSFMSLIVETLGSQTRIAGWHRLGQSVLIEFKEEGGPANLFAPKTTCHIHIAVPGPRAGLASSELAHAVFETVIAICTFALGRSVSLPPSIFPADLKTVPDLEARQRDSSIGNLARKGVSLDIISVVAGPGGFALANRMRTALLTFDAAKQARHDAVACVLFVVTAECLTTVDQPWRDSKLTTRFTSFFEELMPDYLDTMVQHANFEGVFGIPRGRKKPKTLRRELLEKIYDYRSVNVHAGLKPSYRGGFASADSFGGVRRSMFAEFAEMAILRYLDCPRSSVVGHPNVVQDNGMEEFEIEREVAKQMRAVLNKTESITDLIEEGIRARVRAREKDRDFLKSCADSMSEGEGQSVARSAEDVLKLMDDRLATARANARLGRR